MNRAYDMLVNYVSPNRIPSADDQDSGMSFYQEDAQRGGPGRGGGQGHNVGGRGRGRGCGSGRDNTPTTHDNDDEENHVNADEEQEVRHSRNSNTDNSRDYSDASFNTLPVEQLVLLHDLPLLWLLLDSCSTADIFANADLLTDIHDVPNPIWVRCNAGRIQLTQQGYFGNYPYPVWYNPKGVANILSLNNVAQHYRITMDTMHNPGGHSCSQKRWLANRVHTKLSWLIQTPIAQRHIVNQPNVVDAIRSVYSG